MRPNLNNENRAQPINLQQTQSVRTGEKFGTGSERVLWTAHPSWKGMIGWYIKWETLALLISALVIYLWSSGHLGFLWVFLFVLFTNGPVLFIGRFIRQMTTYTITNRRVSDRRRIPGQFFRLHLEEAPIARIDNITVQQSLFEQLLGVGSIDFDTAGEKEGDILLWWGVANPQDVASKIENVRAGNWEDEKEEEGTDSPYFEPNPRYTQPGYIEDEKE